MTNIHKDPYINLAELIFSGTEHEEDIAYNISNRISLWSEQMDAGGPLEPELILGAKANASGTIDKISIKKAIEELEPNVPYEDKPKRFGITWKEIDFWEKVALSQLAKKIDDPYPLFPTGPKVNGTPLPN